MLYEVITLRRGQGAPPLGCAAFAGIVHIAAAQHVDEGLIEHAGRDIDQDQNTPAPHLQPGQVLAVALAPELADLVAGSALLRRLRAEPLVLAVKALQVGSQAVDMFAAGERFPIESGDLDLEPTDALDDLLGLALSYNFV